MKLSFREKKIPKEYKQRIVILLLVFVGAIILFEIVLNHRTIQRTKELEEATLPIVTMKYQGKEMNELHGYVEEMDACYMRDNIMPLDEERKLPLVIHTYGQEVTGMRYEIRSLDTLRKIADTDIENYKIDKNTITTTVQIENLVEENQEYLFVLQLAINDKTLYYYTRIVQPTDCYVKECYEFSKFFHETALGTEDNVLSTYIEPLPEVNRNTLAEVSIHSTLDQIGWDGFDGTMIGEPKIAITDTNFSYTIFEYEYYMSRTNEKNESEYFYVKEYFKIRYTATRMYLLDYQRQMEQILASTGGEVLENSLGIGVALKDMEYTSNETGTIVAFVQGRELFLYDQNKKELTRVFSFLGDDILDNRNNNRNSNIHILNIDESGTMDFVVYGYMNRGIHEGKCGINLYHYDSISKKATEEVFVSTKQSYQILNADFSELIYKTTGQKLYLMVGGDLLEIDLSTYTTSKVLSGLYQGQYAVSESNRFIAWTKDKEGGNTIFVKDLETGKNHDIKLGQQMGKVIAFMEDDLVYGLISQDKMKTTVEGKEYNLMNKLIIVDVQKDEVLKEYQKSGTWIVEGIKEGYTLILKRCQQEKEEYKMIADDTIKNSNGESHKAVELQWVTDAVKGESASFQMLEENQKKKKSLLKEDGGLVLANQQEVPSIIETAEQSKYYVYVGREVVLSTVEIKEAIDLAYKTMGIVIDQNQTYIWKRGRKNFQNAFVGVEPSQSDASESSQIQALSAMISYEAEAIEVGPMIKSGVSAIEVLQSGMKDVVVLDVTGCNVAQVLYYVSEGAPVYAQTGEDAAVLIVGYDATGVSIYEPKTKSVRRIGILEAIPMFEKENNTFYTYVK